MTRITGRPRQVKLGRSWFLLNHLRCNLYRLLSFRWRRGRRCLLGWRRRRRRINPQRKCFGLCHQWRHFVFFLCKCACFFLKLFNNRVLRERSTQLGLNRIKDKITPALAAATETRLVMRSVRTISLIKKWNKRLGAYLDNPAWKCSFAARTLFFLQRPVKAFTNLSDFKPSTHRPSMSSIFNFDIQLISYITPFWSFLGGRRIYLQSNIYPSFSDSPPHITIFERFQSRIPDQNYWQSKLTFGYYARFCVLQDNSRWRSNIAANWKQFHFCIWMVILTGLPDVILNFDIDFWLIYVHLLSLDQIGGLQPPGN
jgi:hypothetical protein